MTARAPGPLASMTGYGRAVRPLPAGRKKHAPAREVVVEASSVNNRFLKLSIKAPDHLQALRPKIESVVKRHLTRGSVTVSLYHPLATDDAVATLDRAIAAHYAAEIRGLCRDVDVDPPTDWSVLLTLPGVVRDDARGATIPAAETKVVLGAVDDAVAALATDRVREGAALGRDLAKHRRTLGRELKALVRAAPRIASRYETRLLERVNDALARIGHSAQPADVMREVAIYADRADVSEELARLDAHLVHFDETLAAGGECGKRFDFLLQEIQREVNTLGSKTGTTDISARVVTMKSAIEKIREQIQNLE